MLVVCQKNADLQHRSRNIRPPAATDRALRRALALKALLAPDCCAVGSGKLRECREPLMYDMSGEKDSEDCPDCRTFIFVDSEIS